VGAGVLATARRSTRNDEVARGDPPAFDEVGDATDGASVPIDGRARDERQGAGRDRANEQ